MAHRQPTALSGIARFAAAPIIRAFREARLNRLVRQQGEVNALNLLAAAHAEANDAEGRRDLDNVVSLVRHHQPRAILRWDRMDADERKAITVVAVSFMGKGGTREWLLRQEAAVRPLIQELEQETLDWLRQSNAK